MIIPSDGTYILSLLAVLAVLAATTFLWKRKTSRTPLPPSPRALPIVGHLHLVGPIVHQSFAKLASSYGPLFYLRLGSFPCVVVSSPELAREFLRVHDLKFSYRQHTIATARLAYNNSAFAFSPVGPYWKMVKRLTQNELLGNRMLNQFLPGRTQEMHSFLHLVYTRSLSGKSINVTEELMKLTNNIVSQMMLGYRSSDSDSEANEARQVVREVTQIFGEFNLSDFIWFCKYLDFQGFGRRIEDLFQRYDALLEKIIKNREEQRKKKRLERERESYKGGNDFLDMMLDVMDDENSEIKITRNNIKALVLDFFTAGTDTSSVALDWALAELINNPSVLEKARQEIESVVGTTRIVQESDMKSLPYIQAIVKEIYRLHPPIPMLSRKCIEEVEVKGYRIPAQTSLFVNSWAMGRDPNVWARPMEFDPERFLGPNESSIDLKGQNFGLLPFGSGMRGCPGISLALIEVPTMLALMIQCFDWKACGLKGEILSMVDMTEQPGLTAPRAHDLICVAVPRIDLSRLLVTP